MDFLLVPTKETESAPIPIGVPKHVCTVVSSNYLLRIWKVSVEINQSDWNSMGTVIVSQAKGKANKITHTLLIKKCRYKNYKQHTVEPYVDSVSIYLRPRTKSQQLWMRKTLQDTNYNAFLSFSLRRRVKYEILTSSQTCHVIYCVTFFSYLGFTLFLCRTILGQITQTCIIFVR